MIHFSLGRPRLRPSLPRRGREGSLFIGFRVLGFGDLRFLGLRDLGFRVEGFRDLGI